MGAGGPGKKCQNFAEGQEAPLRMCLGLKHERRKTMLIHINTIFILVMCACLLY